MCQLEIINFFCKLKTSNARLLFLTPLVRALNIHSLAYRSAALGQLPLNPSSMFFCINKSQPNFWSSPTDANAPFTNGLLLDQMVIANSTRQSWRCIRFHVESRILHIGGSPINYAMILLLEGSTAEVQYLHNGEI